MQVACTINYARKSLWKKWEKFWSPIWLQREYYLDSISLYFATTANPSRPWEVAWNPSFPIAEDGAIKIPD